MLMSPMNAVVLTSAKQKQSDCHFHTCSQLDFNVQSNDLIVWTVTSNELTASSSYVLERNVQPSD